MNVNYEQLSKLTANSLEAGFRLAQISLDSTEKLARLSIELSKQSLEENVKLAREFGTTKDPQDAFAKLNKLANSNLEQAVTNARTVYDIVSQTQAEFTKLAEDNYGEANKALISNLETLTKNAPAGSEQFVNAFKSGLAASAAALNTLNKTGQQVAEFADSSIKAATSATADAVKTAAKRTGTTA